ADVKFEILPRLKELRKPTHQMLWIDDIQRLHRRSRGLCHARDVTDLPHQAWIIVVRRTNELCPCITRISSAGATCLPHAFRHPQKTSRGVVRSLFSHSKL